MLKKSSAAGSCFLGNLTVTSPKWYTFNQGYRETKTLHQGWGEGGTPKHKTRTKSTCQSI